MTRFKKDTRVYLLIILSYLFHGVSTAMGQDDTVPEEPTLTVRLAPVAPYLQGEIVQTIRLIAPHPFEELVLDLPAVEGAETITLQKPRNRKFETYGGEGYLYETSRAIFPERSGALRIPPVRISGSVSISQNEKKAFALREDERVLNIKPPPPAFSDDWWLVASDVSVDEVWSKPLETLRVGDHVTRFIEVTVAGATGAHLPELEQSRSNGMTVLPSHTKRTTDITPNGVVGRISRSFDMRIDTDSPINISPIRVVWWNTSSDVEERTAAPAVRLEPLPRDVDQLVSDMMAEATAERNRSRRGIAIVLLAIGAAFLTLVAWLMMASRRLRFEDRRLRRAVSADSRPIDAVRALHHWKDATFRNDLPITLEQLGHRLGPRAEQQLLRLQKAAFGRPSEPVDAASLALGVLENAQRNRRDQLRGMLRRWLDHFLGQEQGLPDIDRQVRGRAD
ncbi:MAG: hypothetical protein AAFO01_08520 [Pseudomonadota bacterium]